MPAWMILLRDVLLILAWELIRSGAREEQKKKEDTTGDSEEKVAC